MSETHTDVFRLGPRPLPPLATGVEPVLGFIEGIRAVLFDVYGTLFASASGDVDANPDGRVEALRGAFDALGVEGDAKSGVHAMLAAMRAEHERCREAGVDYPEVDILEIWRRALGSMKSHGRLARAIPDSDIERLAIEFEVRANPVWPMPGLDDCLRAIRSSGLRLGIVSNAQFYVDDLFRAFAHGPPEALGFEPDLLVYSYRLRRAKPGTSLFEHARDALASHEIGPSETLYVGNDMLNDILPASRVEFRTALFAGDERSYRPRTNDARVAGVRPDRVVTSLREVAECLGNASHP